MCLLRPFLAGVLVAVLLAGCASRPATSTTSQGPAARPATAPAGATASATASPADPIAATARPATPRASASATAPPAALSAVATTDATGSEQPVAIFHAFDQPYRDVTSVACGLADHGYSHIQIAPAQKSHPSGAWWARYQPVDYSVIDGKGSEQDLRALVAEADRCGLKIIADVVFNHMATLPEYADLDFPNLSPADFHQRCAINYRDGNRTSEQQCWLGGLPDLDQTSSAVRQVQHAHLRTLLDLGIDGFRLDAAKHMPETTLKEYIDFINAVSGGTTWNYLEVISDGDTAPEAYTGVAAVTDFVLYGTMKDAFSIGGDLRSLRVPRAVADPRSVTFGQNHDTIRELNENAINPYADPSDSYLATAYVLAREGGTPLVLNRDHSAAAYIPTGVRFRRIMSERGNEGRTVTENVLAVIDSPTVLMMERGAEGFFVVNKGGTLFDIAVLDLTLTNLEGCYRELRTNVTVVVETNDQGQTFVTRWGTQARGGLQVQGRDALYFIREAWEHCR